MEESTKMKIIASPDKSVAKFATNVNFAKLENNDIVITFLSRYASPESDTDSDNGSAVLIETIMVDAQHAQKIAETLQKVINS
jgi:hypothetical protein